MRIPSFVLIVVICVGCGGTRTVGEGHLQKRTHQRGWHIDLRTVRDADQRPVGRTTDPLRARTITVNDAVASIGDRSPVKATPTGLGIAAPVEHRAVRSAIRSGERVSVFVAPIDDAQQEEPENLMPRKKLNAWAIPALALALGTVAMGFFSTSTLAVVVGIVLTLAVSGISLARMRTREQGGKGFALAGLMIGVIAAIFTAIAIAAYGFE